MDALQLAKTITSLGMDEQGQRDTLEKQLMKALEKTPEQFDAVIELFEKSNKDIRERNALYQELLQSDNKTITLP